MTQVWKDLGVPHGTFSQQVRNAGEKATSPEIGVSQHIPPYIVAVLRHKLGVENQWALNAKSTPTKNGHNKR